MGDCQHRLPLFIDRELAEALVVVKAIWKRKGEVPLIVTMAVQPETVDWAWRREAARYLHMVKTCTQLQQPFTQERFFSAQESTEEWEDMVGDVPGIDDPILSKEIKWGRKFYQSGDVRATDVVLKKPVVS